METKLILACISLIFVSLILTAQGDAEIDLESALGIWLFCEESPSGDATAISQNDSDVYIGYDKVDNRFYFDGLIDEVGILNVALEEEDIQTIMDEGF